MGGGTGPAAGTCATTCTPSPVQMRMMLQSTDDLPLNFGFTGKVRILTFFGLPNFVFCIPIRDGSSFHSSYIIGKDLNYYFEYVSSTLL